MLEKKSHVTQGRVRYELVGQMPTSINSHRLQAMVNVSKNDYLSWKDFLWGKGDEQRSKGPVTESGPPKAHHSS